MRLKKRHTSSVDVRTQINQMQLTAPRGALSHVRWTTLLLARLLDHCCGVRKSKVGTGVNTTAIGAWSNWELRSLLNGSGRVGASAALLESKQQGMAAQQSRQLVAGAATVCTGDGLATVQARSAFWALPTCAKMMPHSSPTTSTSFATLGNVRSVVVMGQQHSIVVKLVTASLLHEPSHRRVVKLGRAHQCTGNTPGGLSIHGRAASVTLNGSRNWVRFPPQRQSHGFYQSRFRRRQRHKTFREDLGEDRQSRNRPFTHDGEPSKQSSEKLDRSAYAAGAAASQHGSFPGGSLELFDGGGPVGLSYRGFQDRKRGTLRDGL